MSAEPLGELLLLQGRPFIPALGFASATLLILCVALLILRSRSKDSSVKEAYVTANGVASALQSAPGAAKPTIRILYGTQTGTAERFAKQLRSALALRYGAGTEFAVDDIEDYKAEEQLQKEEGVIFLMATYGDGEPTDNAADFYNWLVSAAEAAENGVGDDAMFKGLSYGVFGLGNKQYEHFAAVGKKLHKALASLGATPLCRRGDGDDDDDIDADFESWQRDLLAALDVSPLVSAPKDEEVLLAQRRMSLSPEAVASYDGRVLTGREAQEAARLLAGNGSGADSHNPYEARLAAVRELHAPASDRSCLHVELDVSGSQVMYDTGDHVAVFPENSKSTVEAAAACLGLPLDTIFTLQLPADNTQQLSPPFPGPISLRNALARHADVLAPVNRRSLEGLAAFATDAQQAERLRRLASPDGKAEFQAWAVASGRTLLEAMQEFDSAKPSLGAFFGSIAGRLQPRFYSISSSPKPHPRTIHITCAVVREVKGTGRIHDGVASTWLGKMPVGAKVPVFVRKSNFKLPPQMSTPIIMIGPGTGLAPFRGFLQERKAAAASGQSLGPAILFFGCRHRTHDFIYESELRAFATNGALSSLVTAFSRDGAQKDYVQHRLDKHEGDVWRHISEGGSVYVCGDAKQMARDVHRALIALIQRQQRCSASDAEAFVAQLADAGRYQRDVW